MTYTTDQQKQVFGEILSKILVLNYQRKTKIQYWNISDIRETYQEYTRSLISQKETEKLIRECIQGSSHFDFVYKEGNEIVSVLNQR